MKSFFIGDKEVKEPIVQGGMGVGVSLSGLASAVAEEGGVGVISCAGLGLIHKHVPGRYLENCISGLRSEMKSARAKSRGVIGANIMVALTNYADMARTAVEEGADVIFSGAGLPLDLPSFLTPESKTKLVPIVSSARAARIICEKWDNIYNYLPDAIVVEGPKAGGHLGFKNREIDDPNFTLEELVPQLVEVAKHYSDRKNIPIIAAGGITTGGDIRRLMDLGASAVQIGSLFVPTYECDASPQFKQVFIDSSREDLKIIISPVGMPGRVFAGDFIKSIERGEQKPKTCPLKCIKTCDYTKSDYCIMKALYNAAKGNMSRGFAFAGANAYLTEKLSSVKEVMNRLKMEYELSGV